MTNPLRYGWDIGTQELGVRIVESEAMTEAVEDWSRVRSPGRARRRMKRGHRQNIISRTVPRREAISIDGGRTLLMHPAVVREIGKQIAARMEREMDRAMAGAVFGAASSPPGPLTERDMVEAWKKLKREMP